MMLRGLPVLRKFRFSRVLGLMACQRGFEYRQLLVRLEASEAPYETDLGVLGREDFWLIVAFRGSEDDTEIHCG